MNIFKIIALIAKEIKRDVETIIQTHCHIHVFSLVNSIDQD